ncbi:hypothetical protein RD110_09435 [Rhodoferax koreense]|uniref:DUF4148 domain-containing protein n=1 Tax=Rhodoferax koreensis TaxID=1842727 RepID=A0A1P8JUL7_9BURK|nr:DUF4148 domain-containing protein [Rhodoferax koreense]APW37381.1 hypothetical protein RD110_09435 [Rhodoferax koreense]
MNTSTKILSSALIAIASLSAASAFAGDNDYPGVQTSTVSNTTRAQVRAELMQARRDGTLIQADDNYPADQAAQTVGGKTREQVKAELRDAQSQGNYSARVADSYPA